MSESVELYRFIEDLDRRFRENKLIQKTVEEYLFDDLVSILEREHLFIEHDKIKKLVKMVLNPHFLKDYLKSNDRYELFCMSFFLNLSDLNEEPFRLNVFLWDKKDKKTLFLFDLDRDGLTVKELLEFKVDSSFAKDKRSIILFFVDLLSQYLFKFAKCI